MTLRPSFRLTASLSAARLAAFLVLLAATGSLTLAEDGAPLPPRETVPAATEGEGATGAPSPAPHRDAAEWRERRERLAGALGPGTVVVLLSRGAAEGFTGQVRSDEFFYVCPFDAPHAAIVLRVDDGAVRHTIYLPPRRAALERWNGPAIGPGEETAATYGFDEALPADRLAPDLAAQLLARSRLAVSAAAPAGGRARLDEVLDEVSAALPEDHPLHPLGARVEADAPGVHVVSASPALTDLRAVKSPTEIARIRHAVESTVVGLGDAGRSIAPGVGEYQIQALIELRCRLAGCLRQAFDSIVGSGPNSCILHYMANERTMAEGELVVVDVGGEYRGYAADVTRTFPVSGTFSERQAEVYDAVLAAQEAGIAAVRPGVTLRDVHAAAKAVLRERGLDRWFIHGTSHSVGLNVHDAWGRDRKLEVGSVLTVEPGVYIPAEALGVRIEDTVVVTEDGALVLSAGAPKQRSDVEALMREPAPISLPPVR